MGDFMKPLRFYLVTDTHYFEPSLGASGKAFDEYMSREQYFMAESSDIIRSIFNEISSDKETDILIIPGDLSKNGEIESHKGFINELNKLGQAGKKIFVITAGHDFNDKSRAFVDDKCIEVEGTPFNELKKLYNDFGYGDALAVDEETLSYVAQISDGVRMLAINCDSEGKQKGTVDERMLGWMKVQLDKAKADNCKVFAICHYPIVPSVPVFDLVGDAKLRDWRKTASFLADNGVNLVLTGHMHIQSINEYISENGNKLVDICTSCATGSPAKFRKITLNEDFVTTESFDIPEFRDNPDISLQDFFDNQFKYAIKSRINNIFKGSKLKEFGGKIVNKLTLGALGRLLFIRVDKSVRKMKFMDLAGEIGVAIFKGDMPYVEGHPIHSAFSKALKRLGFILKKVEPKLSKNGVKIDLYDMLMNTIGNNKGYSDNNATIKF